MKNGTAFPILMTLLFSLLAESVAEYRKWTDRDGQTVTAEYVRREVESVVLRNEEGAEFKVDHGMLSDADQEYVMIHTPPRIEINVEPGVNSYTVGYLGNDGYDYTVKYEVVEPSVRLRRTSTEHYTAPLTLEMVILGRIREVDRYIIIDSSRIPFSFTGSTGYEFTHYGYPLDLQQIKGSWKSGIEYEGYLVAVRDSRGILIAVKGSKLALEKNADEVMAAEIGSMLTDRLQVIQPRRVLPEAGFDQPQLSF